MAGLRLRCTRPHPATTEDAMETFYGWILNGIDWSLPGLPLGNEG